MTNTIISRTRFTHKSRPKDSMIYIDIAKKMNVCSHAKFTSSRLRSRSSRGQDQSDGFHDGRSACPKLTRRSGTLVKYYSSTTIPTTSTNYTFLIKTSIHVL